MDNVEGPDRRTFLKNTAVNAAGFMLGGLISGSSVRNLMAQNVPTWKSEVGLQLFTVRTPLAKDYEGTLAQVAALGYKHVEPASGYNNLQPEQYKALLDKYGLRMYSTFVGSTDGPDLEKQLEGHRLMGIRYEKISAPGQGRGPGAGRGSSGPGGASGGTAAGGAGRQGGGQAATASSPDRGVRTSAV